MKSPNNGKPFGNSRSLVPDISSRGVKGDSLPAGKRGPMPKVTMSTNVRNNSFVDLKDTGLS